jgi:hypothetical protein
LANISSTLSIYCRLQGLCPYENPLEMSESLAFTKVPYNLNDVRIEAFPSHHLDSMRGLKNVSFILLDEADFFAPCQQLEARAISERYMAKSSPYIVMVSTPNKPEGLFEEIEREEQCLYHRIFLPYHVGLEKIYSQSEIDKAVESPQFEREYNLQYIGEQGNVISFESIERAIQSGLEVNKEYPIDEIPQDTQKSMRIDAGLVLLNLQ